MIIGIILIVVGIGYFSNIINFTEIGDFNRNFIIGVTFLTGGLIIISGIFHFLKS